MELRVLKYYLAVVREGSILGAANSLHMTQPSLSRQMHELEEEIGKSLFERSNRRITLTEEGILSPGGKDHWNASNIRSILTNEKYKGDALLQCRQARMATKPVEFIILKPFAGFSPSYFDHDL